MADTGWTPINNAGTSDVWGDNGTSPPPADPNAIPDTAKPAVQKQKPIGDKLGGIPIKGLGSGEKEIVASLWNLIGNMDCVCPPPTICGLIAWMLSPIGGNLINQAQTALGIKPGAVKDGAPILPNDLADLTDCQILCYIDLAFRIGKDFVPRAGYGIFGPRVYTLLVYNAAMAAYICYGIGQTPDALRQQYGVTLSPAGNVAQSGSDQGTSGSLAIPNYYKNMPSWAATLTQTPYGMFLYNMLGRLGPTWTVLV